jgi:hypothetical protein
VRKLVVLVCVALFVAAACSDSDSNDSGSDANGVETALDVQVVSSRPDMVTGEVALLASSGTGPLEVTVDGRALPVEPVKTWWRVREIPPGTSTLTVRQGDESASLEVTNYPITGPVFSGPHMPLLVCSTEEHDLGKATDENCSAPTKVDYLYRNADSLVPLADPKVVPDDARNVTRDGKAVPFVVRRERGVINRSVYWIDVLDPERTADPSTNSAWNGRLVYRFGGGCGTTFGQGSQLGSSAEAESFLEDGYAVATATFNTFQTQCNDVLSAETAMMVKSRFISEFGVPVHTIGEGGSGGAIQQHLIMQNYPGILDASLALLPFPDAVSIAPGVTDCGLLNAYYRTPGGAALGREQRAAINGHAVPVTCGVWEQSFLEGVRPTDGCHAKVPKAEIYDAQQNPDGLRCDFANANVNQFGRDPETGFASRPLDNVGVQYGLRALADKQITVDQFLDLNAAIGGYDVDGNIVPERSEAKEEALRTMYSKGRVSLGGGDQKVVPIIDLNVYLDEQGDIHDRFRAFTLRDRLQSPNFVIWTRSSEIDDITGVIGNIVSGGGGAGDDAIAVLDTWLDTGEMPPEAADNCVTPDGETITGVDVYEKPGPCRDEFPLHDDPRTAAGAPRRNDILKCQLQPVSVEDYGVPFTAAQQERLAEVFPQGVCDWSQPGVGAVPLEGTWLRY